MKMSHEMVLHYELTIRSKLIFVIFDGLFLPRFLHMQGIPALTRYTAQTFYGINANKNSIRLV